MSQTQEINLLRHRHHLHQDRTLTSLHCHHHFPHHHRHSAVKLPFSALAAEHRSRFCVAFFDRIDRIHRLNPETNKDSS